MHQNTLEKKCVPKNDFRGQQKGQLSKYKPYLHLCYALKNILGSEGKGGGLFYYNVM